MVLDAKTPASAYKPTPRRDLVAVDSDDDGGDIDEATADASHVKGPLRRHLETVERSTPGAGGAWWGHAQDVMVDSDEDDIVGGGMGRAADDAAASEVRHKDS
jgi:hypothetical protein